jgi:serine/threonine-protein kinase
VQSESADPLVGRTLGAGYVVLGVIGDGGMGKVYRAEQRALRRTVAVKIVHPHLLSDPAVAPRFLHEARATSQLNHPNVVSVIDFGKTEEGWPFIVMEHLRGRPLDRVVDEEGLLPVRRVADIVRQTLAALGEAHALGIVHRDLKPANIMLDKTRAGCDFAKVLDFGLAKTLQRPGNERHLTSQGLVAGTPSYMAPEQASAGEIDARTDLYSVGVILYELLSGRLPFEAENPQRMMLARITDDPPAITTVARRPVPRAFAELAMRAVARAPEARFQSADEFAAAVEAAGQGTSVDVERATMPAPALAGACPACGEIVPKTQRFCGGCGARAGTPPAFGAFTPPPVPSVPPSSRSSRGRRSTVLKVHAPTLEDDNAFVLSLRHAHQHGACLARLAAEPGFGRTTTLRRFLAAARASGDVVVEVGRDRWWARPSGHALRAAVEALGRAATAAERGSTIAADPRVRRGLQEITSPGAHGALPDADEYAAMMSEALRWAVEGAASGALTGRIVLGVDDFDLIDGVSRSALTALLTHPPDALLMVVATHGPQFRHTWDSCGESRALRGVSRQSALETLAGLGLGATGFLDGTHAQALAPLYVDQLMRFALEGGTEPPSGLGDLIGMRLEALLPEPRLVLQAMAVLGDDAPLEDLQFVLPERFEFERALASLASSNMIDRGPLGFRWSHPVLREVAAATSPVSVRRQLCTKACEVAEARDLPIEVRAMLAYQAELDMEAMFLSEQVAERAAQRGDDDGAIEALRMGLDAAKREASRGDCEEPSASILVFGRKLGDTLLRAGRLGSVDALLRELVEVVKPDSPEGLQILRGLARLERAEARSGEAHQVLPPSTRHHLGG